MQTKLQLHGKQKQNYYQLRQEQEDFELDIAQYVDQVKNVQYYDNIWTLIIIKLFLLFNYFLIFQ